MSKDLDEAMTAAEAQADLPREPFGGLAPSPPLDDGRARHEGEDEGGILKSDVLEPSRSVLGRETLSGHDAFIQTMKLTALEPHGPNDEVWFAVRENGSLLYEGKDVVPAARLYELLAGLSYSRVDVEMTWRAPARRWNRHASARRPETQSSRSRCCCSYW